MAKRRATVSLRKPSPAPEVEAPVTAAPAVEETPVSAVAVTMVGNQPERRIHKRHPPFQGEKSVCHGMPLFFDVERCPATCGR